MTYLWIAIHPSEILKLVVLLHNCTVKSKRNCKNVVNPQNLWAAKFESRDCGWNNTTVHFVLCIHIQLCYQHDLLFVTESESVSTPLLYKTLYCMRVSLTKVPSDTLRMGSCTCWTGTGESNPCLSAFKTRRNSLTWSSQLRREFMMLLLRVSTTYIQVTLTLHQ